LFTNALINPLAAASRGTDKMYYHDSTDG